jgi:hypothetical protein
MNTRRWTGIKATVGQFLLILPTALVAGCARAPEMQVVQRFQTAQELFDAAETSQDFLRAAAVYQSILDEGCRSGAVLYNQGNAFMRAGQRGRAIACYRRAERYRPRDPFLDHNLQVALGSNESPADKSLIDYFFFWQNWISYAGKFQLLALSALATFALGIAALVVSRKYHLVPLAWIGLAITCLLTASAAYDWYRFDLLEHGVVVVPEVVARKGNGDSYAPAFTQPLREGTEFLVSEHRDDWLLIQLPGDQEGWVPREDVVLY